jgi:predicted aspartyl protease
MLPLRLAAPGAADAVVVPALVDTGADCTLVPLTIVRVLRLPKVGELCIQGIGNAAHVAMVHTAEVEFAAFRCLAQIVAFGNQAILGRDLMNQVMALLDGPALTLSVSRGRRRSA